MARFAWRDLHFVDELELELELDVDVDACKCPDRITLTPYVWADDAFKPALWIGFAAGKLLPICICKKGWQLATSFSRMLFSFDMLCVQ